MDFLAKHTALKIVIEGHCDERGSDEYNMSLGESRGGTGESRSAAGGIGADRIKIISLAKKSRSAPRRKMRLAGSRTAAHILCFNFRTVPLQTNSVPEQLGFSCEISLVAPCPSQKLDHGVQLL